VTGPLADGLRLVAALAQCEIALVRRDPTAPALLAQAARHAEGLPGWEEAEAAARLARSVDPAGAAPAERACRKVVQALCRCALQRAQAALLSACAPAPGASA
jgi:hypothetical protein